MLDDELPFEPVAGPTILGKLQSTAGVPRYPICYVIDTAVPYNPAVILIVVQSEGLLRDA